MGIEGFKPQTGNYYFFISYSRQEVTFAESLARELEKRDIPTWLDIRNLVPGVGWQEQLDQAVENASAVLLIASKKSMASSPVEDEWTKSLARNKRVILIIFEPCEIKESLSNLERVDFTGSFIHAMDKLVTMLKHPEPVEGSSDPLPRKRRAYLPQGVLLFAFVCFWTTVFAIQVPNNFLSGSEKDIALIAKPGVAANILRTIWILILCLVLVPALWNFGWFFIRIFNRTHNAAKVRNSIYSLAGIGFFSFFILIANHLKNPDWYGDAGAIAFVFFVPAMILGGCWFMYILLTSESMYRWAGPTGAILRSTKRDSTKTKVKEGEGAVVALEYAPQDEAYAQAIKTSIKNAGHTLTDSPENAQIVLTLLSAFHPRSNYTPKEKQPLVPILLQSSRDLDDGVENPLLEKQWIDLRYGQESMDTMAGLLHKPELLLRNLGVIPIRTAIYPSRVSLLVHVMDFLQSFALIIAAGTFFLASYDTSASQVLVTTRMYLSIPWLICFYLLRSYIIKRKFWLVKNRVGRFFSRIRKNKLASTIAFLREKNVLEKFEEQLNNKLGKIELSHKFVTWVAVTLALIPTIFAWNFSYIFLPFWLMLPLLSMKEIKMWLPLKVPQGQ